ncbi:MAG: VOC family protein [Bacteroidota bacterium]|jgi:predicted 3-demethylubiquinone-9 3-methyltransferase (glyoxalase superfamily)
MSNKIYPCLWFDGQAKAAAEFYSNIFPNSKLLSDSGMVVMFEVLGKKIMGLNGGPQFKLNASISFMVHLDSREAIDNAWEKLSEGGTALMQIDKYPWAERYGWIKDKFGMTWQLMLADMVDLSPAMLFANTQYGRGNEAMNLYQSIFQNSGIDIKELYGPGAAQTEGKLMFGRFRILDYSIVAMDGPGDHQFGFNEAFSYVVQCDTQDEIDHYWNSLIANGGKESRCGWLHDSFGVSWQIIPSSLSKLMSNPATASNVMQAVLKMNKLDIATLEKAAQF